MVNQIIFAGQFVTVAGWERAFAVTILPQGRDYDRAIEFGHDVAYTVNAGTIMTSDRAYNMKRVAQERAQFLEASVVTTGETVTLIDAEGNEHAYRVKVNGERYSDPIAFKLIA